MCKIWLNRFSRCRSAHAWKKRGFVWVFFVYISVYPFFATPTGHIFSAILTLNGSYDVFLQPLVPFGSRDEIAPHLEGQIPKKAHFGGVNRRFQAKLVKSKNMHIIKNHCIDCNQILHSDKDHQAPFVGGPNSHITNPRWRTAAILEKSKNRHISAIVWPILTKFGTATQVGPPEPPNR